MLKALRTAVTKFESCRVELADLDNREAAARKKLEKAAELGGIADPKVQRLIGDARMILDLCSARRAVLERDSEPFMQDLMEKFRAAEKATSSALNKFIDDRAAQVDLTLAQAMDGESPTSNMTASVLDKVPAVSAARRALANEYYNIALADMKRGKPPGARVPKLAASFCSVMEKALAELKITLPAAQE